MAVAWATFLAGPALALVLGVRRRVGIGVVVLLGSAHLREGQSWECQASQDSSQRWSSAAPSGPPRIVGVVNSQTGAPSKSPVNVEQPVIEYGSTS